MCREKQRHQLKKWRVKGFRRFEGGKSKLTRRILWKVCPFENYSTEYWHVKLTKEETFCFKMRGGTAFCPFRCFHVWCFHICSPGQPQGNAQAPKHSIWKTPALKKVFLASEQKLRSQLLWLCEHMCALTPAPSRADLCSMIEILPHPHHFSRKFYRWNVSFHLEGI